ncbi:Ger(x)C family germination protein [Ureibacillus xyleni]|uniref:Ger(X)C family germination protein n=1 Tax=Ureibacillus xyleni TaxID=614648 RepID=A0A285SR05_9BACL|nr:Ger(x)C family spore germination protein [Ureibacillus xyleni]SOC10644.1 Ger(x)C family germination protein [Ureibacillus xyleni]
MKIKNLIQFSCLLIVIPLLSGCWDQLYLDQRAFVIAIGLDKSEEENTVKITYLISNPELSKQEGGASNEPNSEIITFNTPDLITSKNIANTVVAKAVSYNILSVILISEELAEDENFIRLMYDIAKDREVTKAIPFIVTKESTSKFLNENQPKLETRIHKYFELILQHGSENGYIPKTNLQTYFRISEQDGDLFLAPYATTEESDEEKNPEGEENLIAGEMQVEGKTNKTQFLGSAIFKEGKMIGKLTAEENRAAVLLNDTIDMEEILTTYTDPFNEKYRIGVRVMKKENNKVKMNLKKGIPTIDVTIPLYIDILSNHNMTDYSNSNNRETLKNHIKNEATRKIEKVVKKSQEEFKGDPFGWSLIARKQFMTIPEYEAFNWMESYPKMRVKINVEIVLGKFGRQDELPHLEEMRD